MQQKRLLIIGAGGHAKVVLETAIAMNIYDEFAFIDDYLKKETDNLFLSKWPIVGKSEDISHKTIKDKFNVAVVAIGNNKKRIELLNKLKINDFKVPTLIHPTASISPSSKINEGCVIFARSVIQAEVNIGFGTIVNTSSSIDHECIIKEGVHICPGAHLAGRVNVGKLSTVGIGASVIQGIKIGEQVVIGAGSAVINNLKDKMTVGGVPARLI